MKNKYQPARQLEEVLNQLEGKINAALVLIEQLQKENEALRQQLAELKKVNAEAMTRIDNILDRIDALL